ncbi:MAG TPA: hypothetical protein VHV83_05800, partial [Armatimonadota bacterium]|nr:hypothetical protein [Armatimonadota bacterium]
MYRFSWIAILIGVIMVSVLPIMAESPNECFPNGGFEQVDGAGKVNVWSGSVGGANAFEVADGNRFLRVSNGMKFEWENPEKIIANTDYILSFRVKGDNVKWSRLCLWTRLPDRHEPPNGPLFTTPWKGTFDWIPMQLRFRMPEGITRFIIFFDGMGNGATSWIDDISIHPVNDTPLELDTNGPCYGSTERDRLAWIWSEPGFPWNSTRMGKDTGKAVPHQEAVFRRTITCPAGMTNAKAVFIGDDQATLSVNGITVGSNGAVQDVAVYSLAALLKPGKNAVSFRVINDFGPVGLLGRIEWTANGKRELVTTNEQWECSVDGGKTWKPAALVASPVPAVASFSWVYPQLENVNYPLTYPIPDNCTAVRMAIRATGSFRVLGDNKVIANGASCGQITKVDLTDGLKGSKNLTISLVDICQPPAAQALVQFQQGDQVKTATLGDFSTVTGAKAAKVSALFSPKSWPLNVAAFESASTRPQNDLTGRLAPWAESLLAGSTKVFQIGTDDNSSAEFADFAKGNETVAAPVDNAKLFAKGLEGKLQPQETIAFAVKSVPANGAALVLDVEDADAMVSTVGVFVNGILCGTPQVIGYDQVPGGRLTNRAWVVTIPKERFVVGQNTITLRLLPSFYRTDLKTPENQAEEYIRALNLRDRKENPYPTSSWVQWDTIYLAALAKPAAEPINGRPVWMGTNLGYLVFNGLKPWDEYVLRDLAYLGMRQSSSPIRIGIWDNNQFGKFNAADPALPNGVSVGEHQLSTLKDLGLRPYLLMDPGRDINSMADVPNGLTVKILQRYGQYIDMMEIGNEVDHPNYGWDAKSLAMAYTTIQKEAVCGQAAKAF